MHQVRVNVEHRGGALFLRDHVRVPDLFVHVVLMPSSFSNAYARRLPGSLTAD